MMRILVGMDKVVEAFRVKCGTLLWFGQICNDTFAVDKLNVLI